MELPGFIDIWGGLSKSIRKWMNRDFWALHFPSWTNSLPVVPTHSLRLVFPLQWLLYVLMDNARDTLEEIHVMAKLHKKVHFQTMWKTGCVVLGYWDSFGTILWRSSEMASACFCSLCMHCKYHPITYEPWSKVVYYQENRVPFRMQANDLWVICCPDPDFTSLFGFQCIALRLGPFGKHGGVCESLLLHITFENVGFWVTRNTTCSFFPVLSSSSIWLTISIVISLLKKSFATASMIPVEMGNSRFTFTHKAPTFTHAKISRYWVY